MSNLILVTTKAGREEMGEIEILNCLLRYDQTVEVKKTDFSGVLLVETKIPAKRAASLLKNFITSFILKVIPFDFFISTDLSKICEVAVEVASKKFTPQTKFAVDCTRRGSVIGSSMEVERVVGRAVSRATAASVDLRNPNYVIRIEIIDKITGLTFYRGEEFEAPSGESAS